MTMTSSQRTGAVLSALLLVAVTTLLIIDSGALRPKAEEAATTGADTMLLQAADSVATPVRAATAPARRHLDESF